MKNAVLAILFCALNVFVVNSQTSKIDSLQLLLSTTNSKEDKIALYGQLGECDQNLESSISFLNQGLVLAKGFSFELESKLYSSFGRVYFKAKKADSTIFYINKKIDVWKKQKNQAKIAECFIIRGKYQKKFLQFDAAILSFEEAKLIFEQNKNISGQIEMLNRQGIIHKNVANYAHALPLYYEAFELARVNGMPSKLASTSVNIGVVLKKQGSYDDAIDYYERAKEIYEIEGNDFGLANIYNNIGNVQRLQGEFKKALKNYEEAIRYRKKTDNVKRIAYTYNNIALIHTEEGDLESALDYLKKSEKIKIEYEDFETLGTTYLNYADIFLKKGDEKKFNYYSGLAEQIGGKFQQREVVRKSIINRSEFEAERRDFEQAYRYLSSVYEELDTLDEKEQKILNATLLAHYKNEQRKLEISKLSEKNVTLESQRASLVEDDELSQKLIVALVILTLVLIVTTFLFFYKQKAFAQKSKELENTNEVLRKTTVGIEEKEVLLKEIHHRVKNNLQIIKSLIRLQNSTIEDEQTGLLLLEFEQRVSSMALVHESLYKSGDIGKVKVIDYFSQLVQDLIEAYKLKQEVTTKLNIEIDDLGIDTLVPLGLLTNEIISNSLKHGFEPNSNGIITVDLKKIDDNYYQLYIGDNGKGFDFELERSSQDSLGTELIHALVDQLDGEYEFFNENGAYYSIKFKPQEKK
ncbi:MAG: tetratricopeptide repeat-containing sensor histidine kinase [Crocinitomicaceae bacterium]